MMSPALFHDDFLLTFCQRFLAIFSLDKIKVFIFLQDHSQTTVVKKNRYI